MRPRLIVIGSVFRKDSSKVTDPHGKTIADTMNEFTTAICWKQSAVELDAPWSIAITQLWNGPIDFQTRVPRTACLRRTDDPE
jgi:hypothetical protein